MSEHLFLFIDESGDPGYGNLDSSEYYAELALSIIDDYFSDFNRPILNWRYNRNLIKEMKRPPKKGDDIKLFTQPFSELHSMGIIKCACVYLIKEQYSGPYLKPTSYGGQQPKRFRNFIHRQLLEYYFSLYPVMPDSVEIVFDRFEVSDEDIAELEKYLTENWNLPNFKHFTHANSVYVEALQIVSQLVNLVQEIILEKATFERSLVDFVSVKDITTI